MKKISKLLCVLSLAAICITSILSKSVVMASQNTTNVSKFNTYYSNEIIGKSDDNKQSRIPNLLSVYWQATENGLYLYFSNVGLDAVDSVSGTIVTSNGSKNFSFKKVPIGSSNYYVSIPIKTCTENITVNYLALDNDWEIGSGSISGSRSIPSYLINMWAYGVQNSKEQCLNYHYGKHGVEVGAVNIAAYVRLADSVRNSIISENLLPIKPVNGVTPNVFRYEWSSFYLHVVMSGGRPTGDLVSFGLKW